jgi:hypothetical protein
MRSLGKNAPLDGSISTHIMSIVSLVKPPSHGENSGSSPLGSASEINMLRQLY